MNHRRLIPLWIVLVLLVLAAPATAAPWPSSISLPLGFQPEGIAVGPGSTFYAGSLATGAIYRGDLRTGEGEVFTPAAAGRVAVGMKFDPCRGLLFVAGGPTGAAYIYDAKTGEGVAQLTLAAPGGAFINDVIVTRDAAYFTDSFNPTVYRVSLTPHGWPANPTIVALTLSGDWTQVAGTFNANGIAATADGKSLIVVNSALGTLYRVDPETGEATLIDLGDATVVFGDGILLLGRTLYVVQNQLNQVGVVELDPSLASGTVVDVLTSSDFRVPTTIAFFGGALYAVNARFGVPSPSTADYEVVRVPLH